VRTAIYEQIREVPSLIACDKAACPLAQLIMPN
jgi:hypothetical protein